MLEFRNNGALVHNSSELPAVPRRISRLYRDYETTSHDKRVRSTNPWLRARCSALGVGVTWDDCPRAWFVPRSVLAEDGGWRWWQDVLAASDVIVNHNEKYDAHVEYNDLGLEFVGTHKCTLAQARVFDSDRTFKGGYSLDVLSQQLLGVSIDEYRERMEPYLGKKNKDFGRIPIDLLAEYGCQDVLTNRDLDLFLDRWIPEEAAWVVQNEIKLTSVLIEMERRGVRIDPTSVRIQKYRALTRMQQIVERLEEICGHPVLPTSYDDVYDLLINRYCLPSIVDEDSKTGNTSFAKEVLEQYVQLETPYTEAIEMIVEYRSQSTHTGLFWDAWLKLAELRDGYGVLHTDYNQNVRSGRTSSKQPNAQQLDYIAKSEIRARPGYKFRCYDYSQLEYRWMVHYLNNPAGVRAYNENPKQDYHQWVADVLCEGLVKRRPAKTLNFTIGFGGGKKLIFAMLSLEPEIVAMAGGDPIKIKELVTRIYSGYHRNLPELRQHQTYAENAAKKNGYVKTLYGRRLHLPERFAFKGFNRVIQSTAADNAKEAMVAVSPAFNERLRELDTHMLAMVHDEMLFEVPDDEDVLREADTEIKRCLEAPGARCRVPILAEGGEPADNWAEAKP